LQAKSAEIRRLLGLPADQIRLVLTYSPVRGIGNELSVNSRSMPQIMGAFASYLEVPEAHRKDGSAIPSVETANAGSRVQPVRIRSGKDRPEFAFTAVRYRDHWFWIDDADALSKRALTAVIYFFTLADTGESGSLPLITIPAQ
jgi:hypothetical protein